MILQLFGIVLIVLGVLCGLMSLPFFILVAVKTWEAIAGSDEEDLLSNIAFVFLMSLIYLLTSFLLIYQGASYL